MTTDPHATQKPVPSHGGAMSAHLGLILHVTTNHFDPWGFFDSTAHQASSTFWISDDGLLEEYVDADLRAWAQAGGNSTYNSVETSGTPDQPLTPSQVETLAHLYAWGHVTYGWPLTLAEKPGEKGFGWHGMGGDAWGGHPYCPGEKRKAQRGEVLARTKEILALNPTPRKPVVAVTHADRVLGLHTPLMQGQDVKNVQHALNAAGEILTESGLYDQATADAAQDFKNEHGIKEAGVGPITLAALRAIVHAA